MHLKSDYYAPVYDTLRYIPYLRGIGLSEGLLTALLPKPKPAFEALNLPEVAWFPILP